MAIVRYLVSDVDRAADFYRRLGFEAVARWGPAFTITKREDVELWLSGPDTSAARSMPDGRVPEPGGWNRIVLVVSDITSTVSELKAQGVAFSNEIITGPGGSQTLAEDPDGNVVELFEPRER